MCAMSPQEVCHTTAYYIICKKDTYNDRLQRNVHLHVRRGGHLKLAQEESLPSTGKGGCAADTTDEAGTHTANLKAQYGNSFCLYPTGTKCAPHLN